MRYKPLPRMHLIDTCKWYKRVSVDEYGNTTYATVVDISYVRFEVLKKSGLKSLGEMSDDKYKMFYDYSTSYPNTARFSELDKIVYDGKDLIVREIVDYKDHHCEVILK